MASVFRPGALALITGSASGVGFAFAQHCRRAGMHLALLDIDSASLQAAASALQSIVTPTAANRTNPQVLTYEIDVADLAAWGKVRADVGSRFSAVDVLFLNAGVQAKPAPGPLSPWTDAASFHQIMSVNFFGVVHGLATFLPMVVNSAGPAAVVLTGSKQGITNPPGGHPAYNVSKSAVKTVAEQLAHDLRSSASPNHAAHVAVHLLVPGWTFTGLSGNVGPVADEVAAQKKPRGAWLGSQVVEYGVKKMAEGQFYIVCPDEDVDEELDQARMLWGAGDVVEGRQPLSRWEEGTKEEAAEWIQREARRRREEEEEERKA